MCFIPSFTRYYFDLNLTFFDLKHNIIKKNKTTFLKAGNQNAYLLFSFKSFDILNRFYDLK